MKAHKTISIPIQAQNRGIRFLKKEAVTAKNVLISCFF